MMWSTCSRQEKNHTWTDFVSSNPWLSMIFNALIGSYYREIEDGWPQLEAIMHEERESQHFNPFLPHDES